MNYWDSSALVKLYVPESDSPLLLQCAEDSPEPIATSRIALFELQTTFRRKESEKLIPPGGARILHAELLSDLAAGEIRILEISEAINAHFASLIEKCFARTPPLLIRSSDAIHLASAMFADLSDVVATDKRLREAALFVGFSVFP